MMSTLSLTTRMTAVVAAALCLGASSIGVAATANAAAPPRAADSALVGQAAPWSPGHVKAAPGAPFEANGNEMYTFVNHTSKFLDVNYRINVGSSYFKHLEPGGSWTVTADQTGTNRFVIGSVDGPQAYGSVGYVGRWYTPYFEYRALPVSYTDGATGSMTLG